MVRPTSLTSGCVFGYAKIFPFDSNDLTSEDTFYDKDTCPNPYCILGNEAVIADGVTSSRTINFVFYFNLDGNVSPGWTITSSAITVLIMMTGGSGNYCTGSEAITITSGLSETQLSL